MPLTISLSVAKDAPRGAAVGVPVTVGKSGPQGAGLTLSASVLKARGFEGKPGQVLVVPGRSSSTVFVGLGASPDVATFRSAAASMARAAFGESALATSLIDAAPSTLDRAEVAQAVAEGFLLATYQYNAMRSVVPPRALASVVLTGKGGRAVRDGVERGRLVAGAVALNRDLVNEPPATLTPRRFAEIAVETVAPSGVEVTVWDEHEIEQQRLGGLRGVSLGSDQPPRLVRFSYKPERPSGARGRVPMLAVVGKGITFDSGGLSLKPSDGMITMKSDMSGAAAVLSLMSVIAQLAPQCRVVGYCCLTENMPGPKAFKLGDVLTARNGKTVEIHNTDAEGRLVLMDGLSLAVEDKPDAIIDLATLTGAQIVALGKEITAALGNNADFTRQVLDASKAAGEQMWELPLPASYRKQLDSSIADLKNIGNPGDAGTIVAALFLQEFVADRPWVHLDIAGPSWAAADEGINSRGGTGAGVRTLVRLVESFTAPKR